MDDTGAVISEVSLLGTGEDSQTFALFGSSDYKYTETPTPGLENVYTEPLPLEAKLRSQNEAGSLFFNISSPDSYYDTVVDLHVELNDESLATITDHPAWEEFVPFTNITVMSSINDNDIITTGGTGKLRTKGQSSLLIPACLGLKSVPFQIEVDTPFFGMEVFYLRNHLADQSYMRDHASHVMLKQFGLPYLRSRPVRLFMNGEYVGFYTLMEAPTQAYVMQRSFGVFDPSDTALYKFKSMSADCPYTDPAELEKAKSQEELPDPYYFERGDHRADPPAEFVGDINKCREFFINELLKEREDIIKGFVHYNETCGLTMVELGRVDRDYGPKQTEETMIDFLDTVMYNSSMTDIKESINADQWIKNLAAYTVTLNHDSVSDNMNNWYLATTTGAAGDWSIVQWDHNIIMTRAGAEQCSSACRNRAIYRPILRPACGSVEDHPILGRVLNDEESWQTYLKYVEEFVSISEPLIDDLRAYGNEIKAFIVDDPMNFLTEEMYEETELELNYEDYNTEQMPLLKTFHARIDEVKAQLKAIETNELPRDGVYGKGEICPDWRDDDGNSYFSGSTISDSCAIPFCADAAQCYENTPFTCMDGSLILTQCKQASPWCDNCFPYSNCGGSSDDLSSVFVESSECGPALADCKLGADFFNHKSGICAFNGDILIEECREAELYCKACYPESRCGMKDSALPATTHPATNSPTTSPILPSLSSASPSSSPTALSVTGDSSTANENELSLLLVWAAATTFIFVYCAV
ncbi:hypothetical protein ACHAXR_005068 [Thalassiosira sp. AJA248-18]